MVEKSLCSERKACRIIGLRRSTRRYRSKPLADQKQQRHQRIIVLSWQHPRYGYRRIRALLEQEGWQVSRKQVQRIRRKEGLKVRPKPKKCPRRGGVDGATDAGDSPESCVDVGLPL